MPRREWLRWSLCRGCAEGLVAADEDATVVEFEKLVALLCIDPEIRWIACLQFSPVVFV